MEANYDTESTEYQESDFHDFDDYGIDFSEEPDLRSYQLAYCSENFDISSCDRYAHFNRPFFKTILILRKFNIDILDIFVIALIFNVVFTKHLCDILEKPLQSVIRYYSINFQPYVRQLKTEAKTKKISLQEKVSKYRFEKSQLSVKTNEHLVVHTREPSLSGGASLCESEKQTSLTADTPDSLPSSDETIRNIEKWAFNFTKFALSGPNKNRHKIIVSDWLNALNEQTKKLSSASSRSGYKITFDNISEKSRTPKITKLRAEITPTGSTCVVAHLESKKLILELKFEPNSTFKPSEPQMKSIVVEKLVGELILTPSRDGFGHYKMCASFMGRPQVAKVSYYQETDTTQGTNGGNNNNNNNEIINNQELTLLVYQCIAGMTVDINLSSCNSVPESIIAGTPNQSVASKIEEMVETVRKETAGSVNKSAGGSGGGTGDGSNKGDSGSPKEGGPVVPMPPARIRSADRRLLVKVIKASITSNASAESGVFNPYCVLESDFPSQKHRTNTIHSTNEPFWDEHFLFDVTRRTKTLTVTVYDRDQTQDKNILGQCQIDLMENRRINLSWQTFKLENPYSPGTLQYATITLELMFVGQSNSSDKSATLNNLTSNAVTPANRNSLQISLQELENIESTQQSPRTNNSVTFNMVPAPDPPNPGRRSPFNSVKRGRSRNKSTSPKRSERSRSRTSEGGGPAKAIKDWFSRRDRSVDITQRGMEQSHQLQQQQNQPLIVRLRSKEQLNASGAQSPGVGLGAGVIGGGIGGSTGLGGSSEGVQIAPRVTSPPPVQPTSPAIANSDTSSINSRNSFVNYDCSTLVIESTVEGKYYLISKELAKSGKHGLKGNKLHIYNDHTFVATHFTRSETCEVCLKPISKRLGLGKQGYRCRDCEYTCHKGCHYKTELICANSRVSSMEMEFVGEAQLVFQEGPNQEGTGSANNSLTRNKGGSTNGSSPSQTPL